jgi:transcriptional regulator with XRE-family HTH domain
MRASISATAKKIWRMMQSKTRRDAYVASHISNTVASQILMLREAKGWTQKQLAEKCGMRQSRISALEDPNYENFEAATLRRLASAFDVALTIRFIPFSELTGWTATLSSDKLAPVDFVNDSLLSETAAGVHTAFMSAQIGNTKIYTLEWLPTPGTARTRWFANLPYNPTGIIANTASRREAA